MELDTKGNQMKFGTSLQKRDFLAIAGMACAIASPASPGRDNLKSKAELLRCNAARNDKVLCRAIRYQG